MSLKSYTSLNENKKNEVYVLFKISIIIIIIIILITH